jgi:hypothetical protein
MNTSYPFRVVFFCCLVLALLLIVIQLLSLAAVVPIPLTLGSPYSLLATGLLVVTATAMILGLRFGVGADVRRYGRGWLLFWRDQEPPKHET